MSYSGNIAVERGSFLFPLCEIEEMFQLHFVRVRLFLQKGLFAGFFFQFSLQFILYPILMLDGANMDSQLDLLDRIAEDAP